MWLFNWFKRMFGKPVPALSAASQYDHPDLHQKFPPFTPVFSIKDAIIASAKGLAEEQYKKENELLADDKLREYFVKTFAVLINELRKNDSYEFVLVTRNETKVPQDVWATYCDIFYKACKELGLTPNPTTSGNCIGLKKDTLKAFLDNVDAPRIDIPEKVRALLHTGVYR